MVASQPPARLIADLPRRYIRAPVASKSFGRHDLIIHCSQVHAGARPRSDVVVKGTSVIDALTSVGRTDAPVLRERSVAQNVGPISRHLIYVVSATIAVYGTQRLCAVPWWR